MPRPRTGPCPDCGRPITLQPSGWWAHDGLANGCWRLSMDGPEPEWDPPEDDDEIIRFEVTLAQPSGADLVTLADIEQAIEERIIGERNIVIVEIRSTA